MAPVPAQAPAAGPRDRLIEDASEATYQYKEERGNEE